jgi:multidrug efflux pump subunit AcrA (membrane-fusion protein)
VNLTLDQRQRVVAIPVNGLERNGDKTSVYLVTPDNRIEVRPVVAGIETANRVEVRSGLREGDMVVIGNRSGLHAGQQVTPRITEMTAAPENN